MTSYQKLKFKCEKLQAQVDLFKDALTIARPVNPISIDFTAKQTFNFEEQISIRRNKIINEKIKLELQYWVAENLDEKTILHLLNIKKEKNNCKLSKELKALERMFKNVDPREEYCTFDNDVKDYEIIKSAFIGKEKLEKALKTLNKYVMLDERIDGSLGFVTDVYDDAVYNEYDKQTLKDIIRVIGDTKMTKEEGFDVFNKESKK